MKLSCHILVVSLLFICFLNSVVEFAELIFKLLQHVCNAAGKNSVALVCLAENLAEAELLVNWAEPEVILVIQQPGVD